MQTQYNVKPGDRALIIDSANGVKGAAVGRVVRVLADRPQSDYDRKYAELHGLPPNRYDIHHQQYGKIWPCESTDGKPFVSEHGGTGHYIDCADRWLQRIDDEPEQPKEEERELVTSGPDAEST